MSDANMTLLPRHAPTPEARSGRDTSRRSREPLMLFSAATAIYLVAGLLMIHFNVVFPDALSRVANAYYVLFSRDPHLAAVGFVWNPLPSLSLLPILPLKLIIPSIVTHGVAGTIQSALSMAGAVVILSSCLHKLGVGRRIRLILVALFALQPVIVLYAGSGLSESMLLLFMMMTTSALISWMQDSQPGSLVAAGLALGLGYLTRYEAGALAMAVTALVAAVAVMRATGRPADRLRWALNEAALVAVPFLFAFFLWAVMAKVLIGMWLPTFDSQYGNSAQVANASQGIEETTGSSYVEVSVYLGRQIVALAPLLIVLVVITVVLAIRRRNSVALAPLVVFGSVSAFSGMVLLMGVSFGWLRFQIVVIPLMVLLAGALISMLFPRAPGNWGALPNKGRAGQRGPVVATTAVLVAVAVAIPIQARVLVDPSLNLAREEAPVLGSLFYPDLPSSDSKALQRFGTEREIAAWVDRQDPGEGTILADTAYAFPIIVNSARPETFVIPSDFDYQSHLDYPEANGIKYILVRADADADSVQVRWPGLYDDGAGIGRLVAEWNGPHSRWRLYSVN